MPETNVREQYVEMLWERLRNTEYPSPPMLDRLERNLRSREEGEEYLELLYTKIDQEYPSIQLMDRIERALRAVELAAAVEEALEQAS